MGGLEISERGKVTRDAANWDFWSKTYDFGDSVGTRWSATKPRSFVQFELDFQSNIAAGSRMNYVEFTASPARRSRHWWEKSIPIRWKRPK